MGIVVGVAGIAMRERRGVIINTRGWGVIYINSFVAIHIIVIVIISGI